MRKYQGRTAEPKDAQQYIDWLKAAANINLVDYGVYAYPCTNTVVVEGAGEPVLMNSFHPVLVMEALAPKPGLSPMDEARALRELYDCIRKVAEYTGIREIWFQCADPRLEKFILRKGWTKSDVPLFRMKVGGDTDPLAGK